MQMHGYSHSVDPDEFAFPEDNHIHAHEKMVTLAPSTPLPGSKYRTLPENDSPKLFPNDL